jgi:hypothetical protein
VPQAHAVRGSLIRCSHHNGPRLEAGVAWALWSVTMVPALLAEVGFADVNIADTTAGRGKTASPAAHG